MPNRIKHITCDDLKNLTNTLKYTVKSDFDGSTFKPSEKLPNDTFIVKISANWCGYCVKIKPEYEKAYKSLKSNEPIHFFDIEESCPDADIAELQHDLLKDIQQKKIYKNFSGFPTILKYKNGKIVEIFKGESAQDILNFARK